MIEMRMPDETGNSEMERESELGSSGLGPIATGRQGFNISRSESGEFVNIVEL